MVEIMKCSRTYIQYFEEYANTSMIRTSGTFLGLLVQSETTSVGASFDTSEGEYTQLTLAEEGISP